MRAPTPTMPSLTPYIPEADRICIEEVYRPRSPLEQRPHVAVYPGASSFVHAPDRNTSTYSIAGIQPRTDPFMPGMLPAYGTAFGTSASRHQEEQDRRYGAQRGAYSASKEYGPVTESTPKLNTADMEFADGREQEWRQKPQETRRDDYLAETIGSAIDRLAITLRDAPRRTTNLPSTYYGQEFEDPHMFLAEAEHYCRREGIKYLEWTLVIADRLRGSAHAWYDQYRGLHLNYEQFRQRLLARFDNLAVRSSLQAKLYGQKQGPKEDVVLFISQKLNLFRRIAPGLEESIMVSQIRELLLPEIRINLRGVQLYSTDQLIQLAMSIEQDLKEVQKVKAPPPATGGGQNTPAITGGPAGNRPPYPCRFCGGDHFHRDCRQRPRIAPAGGAQNQNYQQYRPAQQSAPAVGNRQPPRGQHEQQAPRQPPPPPPAPRAPPRAIMPSAPEQINHVNMAESIPLPRLPAVVNGIEVWALLDTGASLTFVAAHLLPEETIPPYGKVVRLASGREVMAYGPIDQELTVGTNQTHVEIYVLNEMSDSIILGQNWLHLVRATIDYQHRCLYFGVETRTTLYWDTQVAQELQEMRVELDEQNVVPEELQRYQGVVNEFPDIFQEYLQQPTTQLVQHVIRLKDSAPFRIRRYQYSPEKRKIIQEEVTKMLAAGVIRRSHSAFSSPIVIVKKKDGTHRFCVDYRQLNQQTEDEVAQLPPIAETLRDLGEAKVFTSLDLKSGYWQVPVHPDSVPYTAFTTPDGATYEFLVMPFGLKCAPTTFQHLMIAVLAGYIGKFVKVYLDDIIIYSNTHDEHVEHLKLVLERLRTHGLKCGLEKCRFGADALDYLGHHVTATHNEPQERHVLKIQNFPVPRTMKELQSFIGTANWLRDYVPDFAKIAAPLTDLLGKKKFRWTPEAEASFQNLKDALSKPLTLSRPRFDTTFYLATDASQEGMGSVLYQLDAEGNKKIISCTSAKFSKTERKYHINEQEIAAVLYGIRKHRQYLEDRPFVLITDSKALLWLKQYKDDKAKLTRWALLLQEYSFEVIHRPGRENNLPDYLSRNATEDAGPVFQEALDVERLLPPAVGPIRDPEMPQLAEISPQETPPPIARRRRNRRRRGLKCFTQPSAVLAMAEENPDGQAEGPLFEVVSRAQRESLEYQATRARWHRLQQGQEEATTSWQRTLRDEYTVENDLIWYIKNGSHALVVPLEYWQRVIYEFHDSPAAGHPGRDETLAAMRRLYYWPAMSRQVRTHIRHCLICASTKRGGALQPQAPLRPRPPTQPWRVLSLDIMGPYAETRNKNKYLLVATDTFSKWVEVQAAPQTTAKILPNFLDNVCTRWGFPEAVITDNGAQFRSRLWERYLNKNHITHYLTPIYHQRANPVERRNQEIKKLLRVNVRDKPENTWDENLTELTFTLHCRRNAATGMSPSELLLGAPLVRPGEWAHPEVQQPRRNDAAARQQRVRQAQARQTVFQRQLFPEPRNAPRRFRPGELVLVRAFPGVKTPLGVTWTGPHPVVSVLGNGVYEVDRNGAQERIHIDDIRPAPGPAPEPQGEVDPFAQPPDDGPQDDPRPEIEANIQSEEETASQISEGDIADPQPGPSRPYNQAQVTIEDAEDSEDESPECANIGIPIVGLWP